MFSVKRAFRRCAQPLISGARWLKPWVNQCLLCHQHSRHAVCHACTLKLTPVFQHCISCSQALQAPNQMCGACITRRAKNPKQAHIQRLIAPFSYEGKVAQLIQQFKYQGVTQLAPYFADAMAKAYEQSGEVLPQALCYVPLTPAKYRKRGFNQARLLAKHLAKRWQVPLLDEALVRVHDAGSQTTANKKARQQLLNRAFVRGKSYEPYKHIVLVDDVFTSGATARACVRSVQSHHSFIVLTSTIVHK